MEMDRVEKSSDRASAERWLAQLSRHAAMPSSSRAFSNRIATGYRSLQAANTRAFLESLFGGRPPASDLPGSAGDLVHKRPGRSLHQSFHTWLVESVWSLTINRLLSCFGVWLSQSSRVA